MANINMSFDQIEGQATVMDTRHTEITTSLDLLKAQVNELTASGFTTDQASAAFNESYTQFTTGILAALEGLTGMAQFLRVTAQTMRDVDSQLAAAVRV